MDQAVQESNAKANGQMMDQLPPPLPERPKKTLAEIRESAKEKSRENVQHIHGIDPLVTIIHGPSTHVGEESGELSGVVYNVASNVPARLVIKTADIGGGRSMYELAADKLAAISDVEKKMGDLLENFRKNFKDLVVDTSIPFEQQGGSLSNLIVLGAKSVSVGFYSLRKRRPSDSSRHYIIIQSYYPSAELQKLVSQDSIEKVYESSLYTDAIRMASLQRDQLATILFDQLLGKAVSEQSIRKVLANTKDSSAEGASSLLRPVLENTYNIIVRDETIDRLRYYDHCFFSEHLEKGMLLGLGPRKGFAHLHINSDVSSQQVFAWQKKKQGGIVPTGMLPLYSMSAGHSTSRRGEKLIVTWGTNVPNPRSESVYEDFSVDGKFYKSFEALGYDFSDKAVSFLDPIKVYVSTPTSLARHLTLGQWLNFPMDPERKMIFLPYEHPFVRSHLMSLYIDYGHPNGLTLKQLIVAEKSDQQGIYFNLPELVRMIRFSKNPDQYWSMAL